MWSWVVVISLVVGCGRLGFDDPDGAVVGGIQVAHLPETIDVGDGVLTIAGTSMLDTSAVQLDGSASPPSGSVFVATQPGGGEVLVLSVGELVIEPNGSLRVVGTRPLVIVADTIAISGLLDGGAEHTTPGAGGGAPGNGPGAGQPGRANGLYDSGGAGGGFGTTGGIGGTHTCAPMTPGGASGLTYGDSTQLALLGGSGGGPGSPGGCAPVPGGAGGGAVQLTAITSIVIDGMIDVGGGGGGGGNWCNGNDGGAGSGGGSGGAIFIEAPHVDVLGALAANGGSGGAGGGSSGPPGALGSDAATSLAAAAGAVGAGGGGGGGSGGWRDAVGDRGGDGGCGGAAGGGGGAVGRITINASQLVNTGIVTP